jgi:hypothetical protein
VLLLSPKIFQPPHTALNAENINHIDCRTMRIRRTHNGAVSWRFLDTNIIPEQGYFSSLVRLVIAFEQSPAVKYHPEITRQIARLKCRSEPHQPIWACNFKPHRCPALVAAPSRPHRRFNRYNMVSLGCVLTSQSTVWPVRAPGAGCTSRFRCS